MNKLISTIFVASFAVIISTTIIFASTESMLQPSSDKKIVKYENVSIHKGDCLSTIALEYNTSDMSTKDFVDYIKNFNNLKTDTIYYGNNILVPIFE